MRTMSALLPRLALLCSLPIAACEHTTPLEWEPPEALPPASGEFPRRLTYNPGDDRSPSVSGGSLAFSRFEPGQEVSFPGGLPVAVRCIALMPPAGGTITAKHCPLPAPVPQDSVVTWVEPALSPDGSQIVYGRIKSHLLDVRPATRRLRVGPADDPAQFTIDWNAFWTMPDGRRPTTFIKPSWPDPGRLRFLAGVDSVFKIKGAGASRATDTITVAYALVDLELGTGQSAVVPGAESAIAYTPAPDGGTWIIELADSTRLMHLAPGSATAEEVGFFLEPALDIANVDGTPVAGHRSGKAEALDLETGLTRTVGRFDGPVLRVAAVPGSRQFVAEVEVITVSFVGPNGVPLSAGSANLWLVELP
jgi:hypothetical protein